MYRSSSESPWITLSVKTWSEHVQPSQIADFCRRFVILPTARYPDPAPRRTILGHRSPPATGYYRCGAWHRAEPRPKKRPSATVTGDREALARPLADQGPRTGRRRAAARRAAAGGDRDRFEYEVAYVLDWKQHLVPELEALGRARRTASACTHELDPRWATRLAASPPPRSATTSSTRTRRVVAAVARVVVTRAADDRRPAFVYTEHNRWPSYRTETRLANQLTFGLERRGLRGVGRRARARSLRGTATGVEVVVHGVDVDAVRAASRERATRRATRARRRARRVAGGDRRQPPRTTRTTPGSSTPRASSSSDGAPVRFATAGQGPLGGEIRGAARAERPRRPLRAARVPRRRHPPHRRAPTCSCSRRTTGLPVTVMEALTLGVPVVATAVGGLPEVVTTGERHPRRAAARRRRSPTPSREPSSRRCTRAS